MQGVAYATEPIRPTRRGRGLITTLYFGEHWGTADLVGARQTETPVGKRCWFCIEEVVEGDRGFLDITGGRGPNGCTFELLPLHRECRLRSATGSIFHIRGECEYRGHCNELREAAGMSLREDALAVWDWFVKLGLRQHWGDEIDDHRSGE